MKISSCNRVERKKSQATYSANEYKSWVLSLENVEVKVWNSVVSDRHIGQERQCPGISRAEDDIVHIIDVSSVFEIYGPLSSGAIDAFDGWPSLDFGMFKWCFTKVGMVSAAHDCVHWTLSGTNQIDSDIHARDRRPNDNDFL